MIIKLGLYPTLSSLAYDGQDGILFYLPIEIPDTLKPEVFNLSAIKTYTVFLEPILLTIYLLLGQ